jgi:hypothetical protein
MLMLPRIVRTGITQVCGKQPGKLARNAGLPIALACVALAFCGSPRAALDVAVRAQSGHALLQLGSASIKVTFDFGQKCPNSNACTGALL